MYTMHRKLEFRGALSPLIRQSGVCISKARVASHRRSRDPVLCSDEVMRREYTGIALRFVWPLIILPL